MTLSLFNIAVEHRVLHDHLMECQNDPQAIADTLEGELITFEEKAKRVAYVIKTLEAEAKAMNDAALEIGNRADAKTKKADSLSEYLMGCMKLAKIGKVSCAEFDISIKNNPQSVVVTDEKLIPDKYWVQPPQPPMPDKRIDKKEISAAIKNGYLVDGAELRQNTRIEIK